MPRREDKTDEMPSVNSVSSLLQLSVAHIVTRIENFDTPANSTTNSVMGELGNLFHQLPSSLLEQVIIAYATNGIDRPEAFVLEYLISKHLKFARFHVYSEGYLTVFPRFENLISLVLRYTAADSDCLRELGIHCKNLRILDVFDCRHCDSVTVLPESEIALYRNNEEKRN
ncbi:hypothetical protein DAPPUDRAFT_239399 [Daphnia pulex]|uniref:Uncharacterized protein n=1 Tax=Daphnia pulex TaxID=6669 RepID=E9G976_DAPPU|nr:hypothetical protein DAPPUDRAFT_239399 [Daphnia pulex]|eukprot:EFX84137.1 hypothetical protein DAPPUDRAFT_239399 [Daphnia pulex]